jgi:tetratricopeptide (TPR) repeat protein
VLAAAAFLTPLGSQLADWTGRTGTEPPAAAPAPTPADAGVADTQPTAPGAQPPVVPPPPEQAVAVPADTQPAAAPPRTARAQVETPPPPGRAPAATAGGRRRGTATAAGGTAGPKPKPPNLAQKLEEARAALNTGDYLAAIAGFEAILAVDPQNPNAADLLGVARGGARNASRSAVDTGSNAEASGDYAGAARHYERALELDPESTAAPDAMRRLKARMQSDGEDAFKRARQYDALGRVQEAISMYEKAVQLLPADHANVKVARDRLAALKGGL